MYTLISTPKMILWEITGRCNLMCRHCYIGSKDRDAVFPWALMKKYIREFADWGVSRFVISGGEPMLHPNFLDICRASMDSGMETVVATNGTLIDEKMANSLSNLKISFFQISLDGFQNVHEQQRQNNTFTKTVNSIKRLKSYEQHVTIRCTLSSLNINKIDELLDFCFNNSLYIDIGLIKPVGNAQDLLTITPSDYFKFIDKLKRNQFVNLVVSSESCHPISQYLGPLTLDRRCIGATDLAVITASRHFISCPYMSSYSELKLADSVIPFPVFSEQYKNSWCHDDLFQFFRRSECKDCILNSVAFFLDGNAEDPYGAEKYHNWKMNK